MLKSCKIAINNGCTLYLDCNFSNELFMILPIIKDIKNICKLNIVYLYRCIYIYYLYRFFFYKKVN